MLESMQMRLIGSVALFIGIFLTGFWLSNAGRPLNAIVFNLHKFIALGAAVWLILTIRQMHSLTPLTGIQIAAILIMAGLFVATIITGGLLSLEQEAPVFVARLHLFLPFLTALSTAGTLILLLQPPAIA